MKWDKEKQNGLLSLLKDIPVIEFKQTELTKQEVIKCFQYQYAKNNERPYELIPEIQTIIHNAKKK